MNKRFFLLLPLALFLSACSSYDDACENITLATEQIQDCRELRQQINQTKGKPFVSTELERRYQKNCVDIRYYRDKQQSAICGNKQKIEAREEELEEKIENKRAEENK